MTVTARVSTARVSTARTSTALTGTTRTPSVSTVPAAAGIAWDPLTSERVRAVVLNTSKDPDAKTTMLLFWPGSKFPWAAAKLPSTPGSRRAVRREASFLLELHSRFSGDVLRTIPRRLTPFEAGLPTDAMLVEALDGVPLSVGYCRPGHLRSAVAVAGDFGCVARWLADLHVATAQPPAPVALGRDVLQRLADRFAGVAAVARVRDRLAPVAGRFAEMRGLKTVVHGDFWMGNVLVEGGRVSGVVDWESADTTGDPLRDVARFALSYALYLDRGTRSGRLVRGHAFAATEWGAGIRYLVTGTGWFPSLASSFVVDAMERLGVDPALWRELLLLGLAEIAAGADNDEWASRHLRLLDHLLVSGRHAGTSDASSD